MFNLTERTDCQYFFCFIFDVQTTESTYRQLSPLYEKTHVIRPNKSLLRYFLLDKIRFEFMAIFKLSALYLPENDMIHFQIWKGK